MRLKLINIILLTSAIFASLQAQRKFTHKALLDNEFTKKDTQRQPDYGIKLIAPLKAFAHDLKDFSPETILKYLDPLPETLQQSVDTWRREFESKNKFDLLERLNKVTSFKSDFREKVDLMKKYRIPLIDPENGNFIFKLPTNPFYLIKIAGTSNKRFNFAADNDQAIDEINNKIGPKLAADQNSQEFKEGIKEWYDIWEKLYDDYKKNPVPFYQDISRAERHIILQKAIEAGDLSNVILSKLYLVPYNPAKTSPVSDETYFVIEEAPSADVEIITKDTIKNIPPDLIIQLLKACKEGYLWNVPFGNKIALTQDKKNLILYDFEQPNRLKTDDGFLKARARYETFALTGIRETIKAIADYGTKEQFSKALEFIEKDPRLKDDPALSSFAQYKSYIPDNFPMEIKKLNK